MKKIIHDNDLTVMATNARYVSLSFFPLGVMLTTVCCLRGYCQASMVEQVYRYGTRH
jgi:hypothetical protein